MSFEQLLVLLIAGLFILGPERLPEAARWLAQAVNTARELASRGQQQLHSELGPEFDELRKPLQDLAALRTLDPRTALTDYLLDDPPAPVTPQTSHAPFDVEAT
jgi:sec-independent protein translocase protein TatB